VSGQEAWQLAQMHSGCEQDLGKAAQVSIDSTLQEQLEVPASIWYWLLELEEPRRVAVGSNGKG
jgi:hypothetical protein